MADPLVAAHLAHRTLHEIMRYPPHPPRVETAEYRAIRHQWLVVEDRACIRCGVRLSTLGDSDQNRYGATQMELHHHMVELSLAEGVDLGKFNSRIVARLRARYPNDPTYQRDFTQQEMLDWIDHGAGNLWPICDFCHRGAYGVHMVTEPAWNADDVLQEDYRPPRHDSATAGSLPDHNPPPGKTP